MDDFIRFAASIFEVPEQDLTPETEYGKYSKWDSIMHIRLIMEVEDAYNIEIPMDEVPGIRTLADLYGYIKER